MVGWSKRNIMWASVWCCIALCVHGVSSKASSTVMKRLSLGSLTARADVVIQGQVTHTGQQWVKTAEGPVPFQVAHIQVSRWIKGSPKDSAERITVMERAYGEGPHMTQPLGAATYRFGEEVFAFLSSRPGADHAFKTVAMGQGKFSLVQGTMGGDSMAVQQVQELGFIDGQGVVEFAPSHETAVPRVPVERLIAQVRLWVGDSTQ